MTRFFRTTPATYPALAQAVDAHPVFRADWIESGKCDHILPPTLPTAEDGFVYIAVPDWFLGSHPDLVAPLLTMVEEITEQQYRDAQPSGDEL